MPQIKIINGKSMLKISVDQGTRLSQALIGAGVYVDQPCAGNGKCGKCTVSVNGEQVLSCRYNVFSDIEVIVPKSGEMLSVVGADQIGMLGENNVLCLDIGTTTLALALVSVDKRHIVKVLTATNPQRVFGADVISRIEYCQKNGISQLQNTLNEAVDALIKNILFCVHIYAFFLFFIK